MWTVCRCLEIKNISPHSEAAKGFTSLRQNSLLLPMPLTGSVRQQIGWESRKAQNILSKQMKRWLLRRVEPLTPTPSSTMALEARLRLRRLHQKCKCFENFRCMLTIGERKISAQVVNLQSQLEILSLDLNINNCVSFSSLSFLSKVELDLPHSSLI